MERNDTKSPAGSFMWLGPSPRTKSPATDAFGKQELNAVIEALMGAQTRARESERVVSEYDSKLMTAVQRIQEYVEEARRNVVAQMAKVSALEVEKKEAAKDTAAEAFVVESIEKSLLSAREQLVIDEMEFERRKALLQHLDQFIDPILVWRSNSFDGLKDQIQERRSSDLLDLRQSGDFNRRNTASSASVLQSPEPVEKSSSSASTSSLPSAVPTGESVPIATSRSFEHIVSPLPVQPSLGTPTHLAQASSRLPVISVVEAVETTDPLKLAMKKIAELESRIEQAERRAIDAEEARICSELRLQQLIELLENERDTARDMRSVLNKQIDPATAHRLVLPRIDQRLQALHAECNKIVVTLIKWMLSWFVPISDY